MGTTWGGRVRRWSVGALTAAFSLVASVATAAEVGPAESPLAVDVHAFGSQGFFLTTSNNYLATDTTHGSFQLSEVGINFTKSLTDDLRMGVQLFAQDLGAGGNFAAKFDWFYLDYRVGDWLGIRAGRLKIPFGLYNEFNDIDSGRVPILLPQSVYPLQTRNFLFAQNGGEVYGFVRSRSMGALDYRLYGGTIYIDPSILVPPGSPVQLQLNVPYVVGGRLLWETPVDGLRLGGTLQALHLDTTGYLPNSTTISLPNQALMGVGSAEYTRGDLVLSAEYSRWHSDQGSSNPKLQGEIVSLSERGYAMATYRVASWLQPGAYYSVFFPDVHNRAGRANRQFDAAATLRFDINDHWLFKLEGHYMAGTAGLTNPLSVGPPLTSAARYWGVFLARTTVYF
jgi:hypothetical protein